MAIRNSLVILRTKLFRITEMEYEMIQIPHIIKVLGAETTLEKKQRSEQNNGVCVPWWYFFRF
jgi:hypothetical protein